MAFPALHGSVAAAGDGTPLEYGAALQAFWESETSVTGSSPVTSWVDQTSNAYDLVQIGANTGAVLESNTQNGFDGINFEETVLADPISRKLGNNDAGLDNFFSGANTKGIHFAGRWDRTTDQNGFNLRSIIASKLYSFGNSEGWVLEIEIDGSLNFRHFMTNGSSWQIRAAGFYSVGDLVLGSVSYNGGNTSGSGSFRLYNNSTGQFVDTGTVSTASGSTKDDDSAGTLVVGNMHDAGNFNDNSPFQGPLFGLWMTNPFSNSLDDGYMQRWIP